EQYFINHADEKISQLTIELISSPYELSPNWLKKRILVKTEKDRLKLLVVSSVLSFKAKKVDKMIIDNQKEIQKASNDEDRIILQQKHISLKNISRDINRKLSRIIIK
ncbi:MAG: hypothetical protein KAV44_05755, partial [Bacteroidales bacterium]|nr:hypothetical protein [Bacteroidales bacterium]